MNSAVARSYLWRGLSFIKGTGLGIITFIGNAVFDKTAQLNLDEIRRVLIIHGEHSSIGDTVLFSSIFPPLRRRFPKAKIDVLIRHPVEEIIKYNPFLNEVIPYRAEEHTNLLTQEIAPFRLLEELKARDYDLIITSEHALRFIALAYLIGARNRVGFDLDGRGFLLTKKVKYPPYSARNKLELEYYLDLVRPLGVKIDARKELMRIFYSKKEERAAESFLKENGIMKNELVIGIHAGGGIWKKRWPLFKFAKLAEWLIEEYDAKVIAFGSGKDLELIKQMQGMMKGKLIVAAGKNILETVPLVGRCKLVIANDSAISHIASTTNARVIALFGVDSPARWGPLGNISIMKHKRLPECSLICNHNWLYAIDGCFQEGKPYCMDAISLEDVKREVKRQLKSK